LFDSAAIQLLSEMQKTRTIAEIVMELFGIDKGNFTRGVSQKLASTVGMRTLKLTRADRVA